ncbi:GntP family gluconate:H+ symporter [Kitasatospora sp. SolWspMP-SS2h]|uniref:GntT/GntP/DsdX family permease n=1 Tax=Kitasatospora sp. SolWspMP-SS2h TaxID=1305729 RepID=UPI000DB9A53C|nr:gluconate:H+ symporter [Kitasatospora sp. SolWspMP-SS2h]RAJ31955.1 GntP family gluconate:H+ symporter [Kitasatospora sp. SolWspMP-SS2h]
METPVTPTLLAAGAPALPHTASDGRLLLAVLLSIGAIVLLITRFKLHPFLALTLGSGLLAAVAGAPFDKLLTSFSTGFGATVASVGLLIGLGAMLGKLLADSGGANTIADTVLARTGPKLLPWAMALIAAVLGLPLFFEVGVVLLVPIVLLVARRGNAPLIGIGIPALAGLSVLHGLVPPHPGPLVAVDALHADLGVTLALGLLVAVPTLIVAGPLFGRLAQRWVGPLELPADTAAEHAKTADARTADAKTADGARAADAAEGVERVRTPRFGAVLATILLPVVLMLGKALADVVIDDPKATGQRIFDFIGSPLIALLAATLLAMLTLGRAAGFDKGRISDTVGSALGPIAGIVFIVGAGGGFKQTLIDIGVGDAVSAWSGKWHVSALLLGWLIAVLIRLATGSATVATITAAGIVGPLAADMSTSHAALLVLAIGAGSLFLSHVNDAGFWLVKEYFGMSVGQTLKSWSVMETIISVVAIALILPLSLIV